MQGATGPTEPVRSTEFPKVVRYPDTGEFVVMGTRLNEPVTLEQIELMDEAGILVRWADGSLWKDVP